MKKILALIIVLSLAQVMFAGKDTPTMKYWSGGEINYNLNFGVNTMSGGLGSGGFGRVIAPGISFGPASIFTDPAELGLMKTAMVYIDTKFGLTNNTVGFDPTTELNKKISKSTDSFLDGTGTFLFSKGNPRSDTKVNTFTFGQSTQFGAFGLSIPVNDKLVLGFGVCYPFEFSSEFEFSGLRTKLQTKKAVSHQEVSIDLPLTMSFASNFNFNVNTISFGAASPILQSKYGTTLLGFSLNRYEVREYVNMNLQVDGMIVLNKTNEYNFNDPKDPNIDADAGQRNDFYWLARGNFKSTSWGFRFSAIQQMEKYNFVVALDIVPKFNLSGSNIVNESYQPKFLTGSVLSEDDTLEVVIDSLDLARPNLTVATHNNFPNQAETRYPSSLTIGADAKFGAFTFGLNFVKYLSEFSFTFDKYKIGKDLNFATKFSMDVQLADKVKGASWLLVPLRIFPFFDFDGMIFQLFGAYTKYSNPHYRMEGGIVTGDGIVDGIAKAEDRKSMKNALDSVFPTGAAISREYTIYDKLHVGVMVFGFPDFAMRYGLAWEL